MPPGGSRQDKKAGRADAGRASVSRNTTPSSVAGSSSVGVTGIVKSQYFGTRLHTKTTTYKAYRDALVDAVAGSGAPDTDAIEVLEKYSEALYKEANHDFKELKISLAKLETLSGQMGLEIEDEEGESGIPNAEEADVKTDIDSKAASGPEKKAKKTKRKKAVDRPLTHGAHSVAVQDGSQIDHSKSALKAPGPSRDTDTASSSLSPAQTTPAAIPALPDQDVDAIGADENMNEVQPLPTRVLVEKPTFGDDPTRFDDPTVYEIIKVQPGMSDDKIRELASVKSFPRSNLSHLTAGSPPDRDFSNNKPANQVQATTFATYSEQYLRPYTEEDMAWLRERGDRITPFTIPALGKRSYEEVWAEEDGVEAPFDSEKKHIPNEARGSMDDMNDATAETDELSAGPLMNRFMSLYKNENRQLDESAGNASSAGNGDEDAGENDDLAAILEGSSSKPSNNRTQFPPATRIAEPSSEPGKKFAAPDLSPDERQKRLLQELIYAGLLPENSEPAYSASADDQIAAKMRELQARLKQVSLENAARKSILQERMTDQMAHQEYNHIGDDLDAQVTNHFQKRSRTMGKKNKKRSGGAGGGANAASGSMVGVAKPGLEGATKVAMDRRKNWKEKVGTVFDDPNLGKVPRDKDPDSSIFTKEAMAKHMVKEAALWDEEDGEADDE